MLQDLGTGYVIIDAETFFSWAEAWGIKFDRMPDYCSAIVRGSVVLPNGVEVTVNATGLTAEGNAFLYARDHYEGHETVTHIKMQDYWGSACNFRGKGARSAETREEVRAAFELLFPGRN